MSNTHGIWNQISEESKDRLVYMGEIQSVPKGTVLFEEGQRIPELYMVLEGYIALYRSSRSGGQRIIFICGEGELINESVVSFPEVCTSAKTLSKTVLLTIDWDLFVRLTEQDASLGTLFVSSLTGKNRRLYHQLGNANGTDPLERRLNARLWKLARDYGIDTPDGRQIGFEINVTMLAEMLGAKRESVSRAASVLRKEGLLLYQDGKMTVTDLNLLRKRI